jgi:nucleoid-associated protein YgaU
MSIFGKIKSAIFGSGGPLSDNYLGHSNNRAAPPPPPATAPRPAPAQPTAAPAPKPAAAAAPAQPAAPAATPVDPEAAIARIAAEKGNPDLNWKTSIVDLMKLLDLDSSLANRKELATELGYQGATDGSADMNNWLHQAVMRELGKSGGAVPANLKD